MVPSRRQPRREFIMSKLSVFVVAPEYSSVQKHCYIEIHLFSINNLFFSHGLNFVGRIDWWTLNRRVNCHTVCWWWQNDIACHHRIGGITDLLLHWCQLRIAYHLSAYTSSFTVVDAEDVVQRRGALLPLNLANFASHSSRLLLSHLGPI